MTAPRTWLLALPLLLLAACGPLEEDSEWAAEQQALAQVLPDVAEPSPPGDSAGELDARLPLRERQVQRARELTLPSPGEEWQLTPEDQDGQRTDSDDDGRAQGDEAP